VTIRSFQVLLKDKNNLPASSIWSLLPHTKGRSQKIGSSFLDIKGGMKVPSSLKIKTGTICLRPLTSSVNTLLKGVFQSLADDKEKKTQLRVLTLLQQMWLYR
jgi:hypothetical protein